MSRTSTITGDTPILRCALVLGASRGIGAEIALSLAREGFVVVAGAKTTGADINEKLPGTVDTVCNQISAAGGRAVPLRVDVRDADQVVAAVADCHRLFGRLDVLVYNAGAAWWNTVENTPLKRFDLLHEVNVRGFYAAVKAALPLMKAGGHGRIVVLSPPIYSRFFKGKVAYSVSKIGATVLVHGLAQELQGSDVSITALWPATAVESFVTLKLGTKPSLLRTSAITADACVAIAQSTDAAAVNGQALLDEDYLASLGVKDFARYRCVADVEPPRMMPRELPSLLVAEEIGAHHAELLLPRSPPFNSSQLAHLLPSPDSSDIRPRL